MLSKELPDALLALKYLIQLHGLLLPHTSLPFHALVCQLASSVALNTVNSKDIAHILMCVRSELFDGRHCQLGRFSMKCL